jgi:transketolase
MQPFEGIDRQVVAALRVLAVDQVEQARSGHPGMPLGAAPMAYVLWSRFLRHDPTTPGWPDRDRFVLSAGHGSALLYALLHLFGYDLPLAELRRFRQWGSRTPGHPEHGHTPGVETTTGPLGQGLANAVGMALAERRLAAAFNRDGLPIVDHRTWVIAGDGDLMEGISHEAASLAGHLRLGRLVVLFDDNHITIDGPTSLACSDDVARRFSGYGWRTLAVEDGNDLGAIADALSEAASSEDAPALIRVRTHIGFGSPHKQDSAAAHGAPLGPDEAAATRRALGWPIDEPFVIPDEVSAHPRGLAAAGARARREWEAWLDRYAQRYPALAADLRRRWAAELPVTLEAARPDYGTAKAMATREASGRVINALSAVVPELIGGSADLTGSNDTEIKGAGAVSAGHYASPYVHFGVREHAMASCANGLALHGGLRPFVATFLIFADYLRPALRLSALMGLPVIYIFTHDSVSVGEDGPTHQPVEHLASLRAIPNLVVLRPADAHEAEAAWRIALARRDGPTALVLSRQKLPILAEPPAGVVARGAFIRAEASNGAPRAVLLATGSEVSLALAARSALEESGVPTRVVSVPSLELFGRQDSEYKRNVLGPDQLVRAAVEMGRSQGWHSLVGAGGLVIGLERFGASAPGDEVAAKLGFTADAVAERVRVALAARRPQPLASAIPRPLEAVVAGRHARLDSLQVSQRICTRDAALWGDRSSRDVARRLGWLDSPGRLRNDLPVLGRRVAELTADGADTLVLVGMGGSSLAPRVLREVGGNPSGRELLVVDTTDPDHVGALLDTLEPGHTAVLAVSKSGTTAETTALSAILWERMRSELGERTGGRFLALTEPGTPLDALAREHNYRAVLPHPVDVGGRFAALTAVGVFPALWLGHDAESLLAGGERALRPIDNGHPAVELATVMAAVGTGSWSRLAWCASDTLRPLGAWAEQLVAESTGKDGKGVVPVVLASPPAAATAWPHTLYFSPRLEDEDVGELDAALDELYVAGHAVVRWRVRRNALGEAFAVLELATAIAGLLLGVNPFDEPDVVHAKDRARAILSGGKPLVLEPTADPARELVAHLDGVGRDNTVAILAYLPEDGESEDALGRLAAAVSARTGAAVTTAFGPRYLHSTGQLHKGGPDGVVPVVLTSEPARDVGVPGRRFTLGGLRQAQAMGDVAALHDVGRRVLHLHLGDRPSARLKELQAALQD